MGITAGGLLAVGVVLLAACAGGGDGAGSSDGRSDTEDSADQASGLTVASFDTASSQIGEAHGPATGFAVAVVALDEGYSVEQIVDGAPLSADGSISGVQAAAKALEVLSAPTEPNGFRRRAQAPDEPSVLDLRVEFLGATLMQIHTASFDRAQREFDEATAKAREGLVEGDYQIIYDTLVLVGRGYTLEQALTGVFLGPTSRDGLGCLRLRDEQPEGVPIRGALRICPQLEPADGDEPTEDDVATEDGTATTEDSVLQSADELGFEPGTFTGSLDESFDVDETEGEVLIERIEFVAGDTLTGTLEFMAQGSGIFGGSAEGEDRSCFYLIAELTDVALLDPTTGQYSGTAQGGGDVLDGPCPGGGPPPVPQIQSTAVTAKVDGDTLTVTLGDEGDELTVVATRVGS